MAMGDYRACDVCGGKSFYDATLNYNGGPDEDYPPFRLAGKEQDGYRDNLPGVGDWAVLCHGCAKTHRTQIVPIELPAIPSTPPVSGKDCLSKLTGGET